MAKKKQRYFAVNLMPRFLYHNALDLLFFAHVQALLMFCKQQNIKLTVQQAIDHFRETYELEEEEYNDDKANRKYYEMFHKKREIT